MTRDKTLLIVKVLLSIVCLEFFGPTIRDYGPSHAFHPDWPGHARVHLVWLLGFMSLSGFANLYLIWWRPHQDLHDLWISVAWLGSNLGGFWIAYVLASHYSGAITVPGVHVHVFGYDENVVAFTILSIVLAIAIGLMLSTARKRDIDAAH